MWNLKITTGTADRTETVQEFTTREGLVRELESLGVPAGERRKAEGSWTYGDRYEWSEVAETATETTPEELTDLDITVHHVGSIVTVVADASPYDGIKAVNYTGTLVKLTRYRAYVRREGCRTARPFTRGPRFRYLLHAGA